MENKRCTKCGEIKPLEEFKRDKRREHGRGSHCKTCHNGYNPGPGDLERRREFMQRYKGRYVGRYSGRYRETYRRWQSDNPMAQSAHRAVEYAVRKGVLPKVSDLLCAQCFAPATDYHHHRGYDRPHRLDVIPLCRSCHRLTQKDSRQLV